MLFYCRYTKTPPQESNAVNVTLCISVGNSRCKHRICGRKKPFGTLNRTPVVISLPLNSAITNAQLHAVTSSPTSQSA